MLAKRYFLLNVVILFGVANAWCFGEKDTLIDINDDEIKKGWSLGILPATVYNSDVGFRYGAIAKLYYYGDKFAYPQYTHQIGLHWSKTTKGCGNNELFFDSRSLINNLRTTFELSYLTEKALDFYGFNGYEANYNTDFEDISEMYYRMDRKLLRIRADFQGNWGGNNWKWVLGTSFYNYKLDTVDLNKLNKGRSSSDKYPYISGGLYGNYITSGLIQNNETDGGTHVLLKAGLIFDTRESEANPMSGVWSDIQLITAPSFISEGKGFVRITATHRHYFTLVLKKLSLACRVSAQNKVIGTIPFYILPIIHNLAPYSDEDGLGGTSTLRGILRNRVVGNGVAYGNMELRWKFLQTVTWDQNVYLALSAFIDGGMVTQKYKTPDSDYNINRSDYFTNNKEMPHLSGGGGFHFVLNENFIISADFGKSFDKRDGVSGFYLGIGFLY